MISTEHTQSLSDFRQNAGETLDRLNKSGEAEILTVNGEARAVLLSPKAYDRLAKESLLARDASVIRRAIQQLDEGEGQDADLFFDGVRAELLKMKTKARKGTKR